MTSFKKSFVTILDRRIPILDGARIDDSFLENITEQFSGDSVMIEEITILVCVDTDPSEHKEEDKKALATLDPLSQLLWLQALRHLH